ncbi:hypothetical protein [Photobacterium phosphoreum]|uniref:hypothetical protein n=1 Tax=Photobacterium phosphoreum TaxID=659 RepID=UPI000D18337F|nr:hypothetical protein [Photobacterium phosphoreum]MCD9481433.1 hypothetical protein [Photobacterium phosphoreum]
MFIVIAERCLRFDGVILTITKNKTMHTDNKRLLPHGNNIKDKGFWNKGRGTARQLVAMGGYELSGVFVDWV